MESNLSVLILAAGESRRYKAAGYGTPKGFLQIRYQGHTGSMISHVQRRIPLPQHDIYVAVPRMPTPPLVKLDFGGTIIVIEKTRGQADTIYQATAKFSGDLPILVLDCDMLLKWEDLHKLMEFLEFYDSVVAVTKTFDPNASRVNSVPFPTEFVEKKPISEWGMVGARGFENIGYLRNAIVPLLAYESEEPYLSTAMNWYPGITYAHVIRDYVDWGTPERLLESGATIEG